MAKLIVVEGIDGSGKSSLVSHIADLLGENGITYVTTKQPGGSTEASNIRKCIMEGNPTQNVETLLMCASRLQDVHDTINPAFKNNNWVISDRYEWSTEAYQGSHRDTDPRIFNAVHEACFEVCPAADLTILLDCDPEVAKQRLSNRNSGNRMDEFDLERVTEIREAFLDLVDSYSESNILVVDASKTQEEINAIVDETITKLILDNILDC